MTILYHFQLVFLRLLLKRNALSDSKLKITLLQNNQTLDPNTSFVQTDELNIRKNQKIIDLDSLKTFHFEVKEDQKAGNYTIKYEIKGTSEERVRTIPVNVQKMIDEYQKIKKGVFQQSFVGQNAEITYKFYITKTPIAISIQVPQQENQVQGFGNKTKRSNSINRTKRPPSLNINKRALSPNKQENIQPPPKQVFGNFQINRQDSQISTSTLNANLNKLPQITLNNAQSRYEDGFSAVNKKPQSLPLSEIQKVKELIQTHHSPHEEAHYNQLSLKLKTVIALLLVGIMFLIVDTLSDRKIRRILKKQHDNHNHHAKHSHNEDHQFLKEKKKKAARSRKSNSHSHE